jgi:large subunit ribosomal protein L9
MQQSGDQRVRALDRLRYSSNTKQRKTQRSHTPDQDGDELDTVKSGEIDRCRKTSRPMAKTSSPEAKATKPKPGTATKSKASKSEIAKAKAAAAAAGPPRQPGVERRHNHPTRAKLGYVHLILTQNQAHLGQAGDLVKVRPGFARNFLVPQGLATFATPNNLRMVEKHRQRMKELEEAKRADLQSLATQIAQRSLTIEANANAEGHLYGSVNADQIAQALRGEGFPIEAEAVRIEGPLKELGLYSIKVHLAQEIFSEVKLWVVPTHTDEPTA